MGLPTAKAAGISTTNWATDLPSLVAGAWANAFAAFCVWGVLGLMLAVLARSSAIAISVGVGYVLVVDSIVKMAATGSSHWLLGSTLSAPANGGEASLSYGASGGLGLLYVVIGLLLATVAFTCRDVTD